MSNQIFKTPIPNEIIFLFLQMNCIKNGNCFIFNTISFKKGLYNESIKAFLEECDKHYHFSKKKYLDINSNYAKFITVLRQICKCNELKYASQIKYERSAYEIIYYIYTE
jgi:hypothetical protein